MRQCNWAISLRPDLPVERGSFFPAEYLLRRRRVQSLRARRPGGSQCRSRLRGGLGQRLTHSMASSRDLTCQSQKPATSSLVSAKGPSVTVQFLPEKWTRAPLEEG